MKKLLLLVATSALASSAIASEAKIKLEGSFNFQAAARNQKNLGKDNHLTNNHKDSAFKTKGTVGVDVSNETENGVKYGANLGLKVASSESARDGSFIYVEADQGRLEVGSRNPAQNAMSVSAYSISAATGDDWTSFANLEPEIFNGKKAYNGGYSDYSAVNVGIGNKLENLRNVTYYTPKYNGLQAGFSYAPDSSNIGDSDIKGKIEPTTLYKLDGTSIDATISRKNIMGAALTYEHNLSDGVDLKLGAGYEHGKYNASYQLNGETKKLKLADHKVYNVGATLSYGKWSVAGSYADLGKSGTNSEYFSGKAKNTLYTGGVAYKDGPLGVSLTYLHNSKMKNKLDAYTLGTDYVVAPGLKPYAEVTSFNYKNRGYQINDNDANGNPTALTPVSKKLNGMVYLLGMKVSF
jgi:hypothetical protein